MRHFGRCWWVTVLTIFVEGLLGILSIHGVVEPEEVAAPAIAIAAACASHNAGRAWEDGQRNKAAAGADVGRHPKKPEADR